MLWEAGHDYCDLPHQHVCGSPHDPRISDFPERVTRLFPGLEALLSGWLSGAVVSLYEGPAQGSRVDTPY